MWIRLNAILDGALSPKAGQSVPTLINTDQVCYAVEQPKGSDDIGRVKLIFEDGKTLIVAHSLTRLEAEIKDAVDKSYVAPEPKDP